MSSQVFDLNEAGVRLLIAKRLKEDIDAFAVKTSDDGFRWHLGASVIGEPCKRRLWYGYRWVQKNIREGRMYRLLDRGNLEELRYVNYLKGIGAQVWTHEEPPQYHWDGVNPPYITKKGKQFRASWLNGHFGGSLDSVVQLPEAYQIIKPLVAEFKTNSTGRGFNDLVADGVAKAKIPHFVQQSIYGYGQGIEYGVYFNTNKNDDDMHIEIVKLDHELAKQMIDKAESIILSEDAPPRISDNPTYLECKVNCAYKDICHSGKTVEKNCRSCTFCSPTQNSEFYCSKEQSVIPRHIVYEGCGNHKSITLEKPVRIVVKSDFQIDNVPLPE